jgi:hypothetical protein
MSDISGPPGGGQVSVVKCRNGDVEVLMDEAENLHKIILSLDGHEPVVLYDATHSKEPPLHRQ